MTLFTIDDVALRVDRAVLTIKRWEKKNLIPAAKRDSRGWRIYTKTEVEHILDLVKRTDYFRNPLGGQNG